VEVPIHQKSKVDGSQTPLPPSRTAGTTRDQSRQRHDRSNTPSDAEHSENSRPHKVQKVPHIEELVQKRIKEANLEPRKKIELRGLRTSDSPLTEEILSQFPEVRNAEFQQIHKNDRLPSSIFKITKTR